MRRAVDASTQERRRIAGTLHDGVVQQLAAAAFTIAGESRRAEAQGDHDLGDRLAAASDSVRDSVAGMRSLLVDIYPPSLRVGGLASALADLAKTVNGSQATPHLEIDPDAAALLDAAGQRAVSRVAQECLRNAVKHSGASNIGLRLSQVGDQVRLDVFDDGVGIDSDSEILSPEGHFGMQLMADVTIAAGATLSVFSSEGEGALFRMEIPHP
jgi:two-component system, NarL family, sensor kinase